MSENQKSEPENSNPTPESHPITKVGVSAHLDIIVPVEIRVDPDELKSAVIGEFEGVPVVDGEAFKDAGNSAELKLLEDAEIMEIFGEIIASAYRIKVLRPGWKEIKYLVDAPMRVFR